MPPQQIQSEDLNELLKLYQNYLETNDQTNFLQQVRLAQQKLVAKYKNYQFLEQDKKLLNRFLARIQELYEISNNKGKALQKKNLFLETITTFRSSFMSNDPSTITFKNIFHNFNTNVFDQENKNNQRSISARPSSQNECTSSSFSWYQNTLQNKALFNHYETTFWSLYDILLLDRSFFDSLYIFHQTKKQNFDRLYNEIKSRNVVINHSLDWLKNKQINFDFDEQAQILSNHIQLKLNHTCMEQNNQKIISFFPSKNQLKNQSPKILLKKNRDKKNILNMSPLKKLNGSFNDSYFHSANFKTEKVKRKISEHYPYEKNIEQIISRPYNESYNNSSFSPQKNRIYNGKLQSIFNNFPEIKPAQNSQQRQYKQVQQMILEKQKAKELMPVNKLISMCQQYSNSLDRNSRKHQDVNEIPLFKSNLIIQGISNENHFRIQQQKINQLPFQQR